MNRCLTQSPSGGAGGLRSRLRGIGGMGLLAGALPQAMECTRGGGGGALEVRISSISHNCFVLVRLACFLVPCASPVQRLREVWLRHLNFPHFFAIGFDAP